MARRLVLERLFRLRELQEEQALMELEVMTQERSQLVRKLAIAVRNQASARNSFVTVIGGRDTAERTGAAMEMEHARMLRQQLEPKLTAMEAAISRQRDEVLGRRTGRLQVATLLDREQARVEREIARKAQQMLDDWYGRRPGKSPEQ